MSDWKEVAIADCIGLQKQRATLEQERAEDEELKNVELTMKKVANMLSALEQPYTDKIDEINTSIEELRESFVKKWDIPDKTYECDIGIATLRTTKALKIVDKKQLISILLNIDKLPEAIRSWNLSYLRKFKDVDMIDDSIAHYDEHLNVVIKGVSVK